jgi:hypothetical protein
MLARLILLLKVCLTHTNRRDGCIWLVALFRLIGISTLTCDLHIAPQIDSFQSSYIPTHHYKNMLSYVWCLRLKLTNKGRSVVCELPDTSQHGWLQVFPTQPSQIKRVSAPVNLPKAFFHLANQFAFAQCSLVKMSDKVRLHEPRCLLRKATNDRSL